MGTEFKAEKEVLAPEVQNLLDEWARILFEVDISGIPTVQYTPNKITLEDFIWTRDEVETALINGLLADKAIDDPERGFLKGLVSGHPETVPEVGDYRDRSEFYRTRTQPHHIDLYVDVHEWIGMIEGANQLMTLQNRLLVAAVALQKAKGRSNIDWVAIQRATGVYGIKPDTMSRRYRSTLDKLACKLTEIRYPRRRK